MRNLAADDVREGFCVSQGYIDASVKEKKTWLDNLFICRYYDESLWSSAIQTYGPQVT